MLKDFAGRMAKSVAHSYNQTLTLAKARMDFGVNDA